MGTCCTRRERFEGIESTNRSFDLSSHLNEIQNSFLYANKFLDENRDAQMIVFCFGKDQLRNFVLYLNQIMKIIKTKTDQIFIPTVVQNSPINTQTEMLLVMRNIEQLDKFTIDSGSVLNDEKLANSFTIRNFQFHNSDPNERAQQLLQELKNYYEIEGLMIIGGVQDPGKVNNLNLLFYKTETHRVGAMKEINSLYEINVLVYSDNTSQKDYELLLNQAFVDQNSQLRSVITFEDTYSKHHFVILQEQTDDRLYLVTDYPHYINEQTSAFLKEYSSNNLLNEFDIRLAFSEKMSQYMNIQEKKNGNRVVECITNNSLKDSFVVYCQ